MIHEKIDLYAYFGLPRGGREGGTLTAYSLERTGDLGKKLRPGILIVPGGGYGYCSAREGEPVAMKFLSAGYDAFVLEYSVFTPYPAPLVEAAAAMAYLRENADRYSLDPAHVAAVGFSAGGHLTGMLGNLFADEAVKEALKERAELVRPDAVLLCYGVLSTGEFSHDGTSDIISGGDKALRARLSLENRVTEKSSPAFLWHTGEDDLVPAENSLLYAAACRKAKVPFELHIFEKGRHGLSVANKETEARGEDVPRVEHVGIWTELALAWLSQRGFEVRCL